MVRKKNQANQPKQNKSHHDPSKQTFLEHLYELRKRLFWVVLTLVLTTGVGLEFKDRLIEVVMAPLKGGKLVYLTPGGGFSFIFTLSLYFGVLLTIPVIILQIYRFLEPIMKQTSRKFIVVFMTISTILAALGASLAYFLAIPGALGFLNGVAGSSIVPNLTADSYLTFVVTYVVGMAVLFQLPLLLFLFDHIRPIPPGVLGKSQRYGIVGTTILAGLITPSPDLLNYSIVLFPILGTYELGVFVVWMRRKLFRDRAKSKVSKAVQKMELAQEVMTSGAPLTAIVEEMAEENGDQLQPVRIEPVRVVSMAELISDVVTPSHAEEYIQPTPTPAQSPAQLTPNRSRGRSIDGMRISRPYRMNVQVPPRNRSSTPQRFGIPKNGEESADGLLTAAT